MAISRTTNRATPKTSRPILHAKKLSADDAEQMAEEKAMIIHEALTPVAYDSGERHEMIERLAYSNAESRGFTPGHELEDWLAAEAMVDSQLMSEGRAY